METYERSELGGVGERVLGVWHGWRIMAAAPSQDLLGNTFPSQVCLSREGREGGFPQIPAAVPMCFLLEAGPHSCNTSQYD